MKIGISKPVCYVTYIRFCWSSCGKSPERKAGLLSRPPRSLGEIGLANATYVSGDSRHLKTLYYDESRQILYLCDVY
jgi:hypothetical protein